MKSQKGISPLIASVLLIAFTVSVAMIVMGWFSGFVRTTTENVTGVSQQAVGCSTAVIDLDHVYVNAVNTSNVSMVIRNEGSVSLTINGMLINISGGSCTNAAALTLSAGTIGTLNLTNCLVPNVGNFSKAIITTSCSGITDTTSKSSDVTFT
jgi:flagellin-like protein